MISMEKKIFEFTKFRGLELEEKENFVQLYQADDILESASEEEVEKYRCIVDELCFRKSLVGMRAKAYACYGGNRAYPCDWILSRDLLLQLMEQDEDPFLANSLGYIYYYGRCNQGTPEYEKAFYYFSIGAAGGCYESSYKLADMFANGYGVKKNMQIAENIIVRYYKENRQYIQACHFDTKFADLAFRMGNLYFQEEAYNDAYYYYLQADFAIRMRQLHGDYYGDRKVAERIRTALEKTLPLTDYVEKSHDFAGYSINEMLRHSYLKQYRLEMRIKKTRSGRIRAKITICKRFDESMNPKFFLTIPEAHYCGFKDEIKATLADPELLEIHGERFDGNQVSFQFDEIRGEDFYLYGEQVASIWADWRVTMEEPDSGTRFRMASCSFPGSELHHEFRCMDPKIKEGDWVYLRSRHEIVWVHVIKIYEKTAAELARHYEEYPIVRRKIEEETDI